MHLWFWNYVINKMRIFSVYRCNFGIVIIRAMPMHSPHAVNLTFFWFNVKWWEKWITFSSAEYCAAVRWWNQQHLWLRSTRSDQIPILLWGRSKKFDLHLDNEVLREWGRGAWNAAKAKLKPVMLRLYACSVSHLSRRSTYVILWLKRKISSYSA